MTHDQDLRYVPPGAQPAVFAAGADVVFSPPSRPDEVEFAVTRFLAALFTGLADAGCTLVGHIKGAVKSPGRGDLAFHATSLVSRPQLTGGLAGDAGTAVLTVNAIVFGIAERELADIVVAAWQRASDAETAWRR